MNGLQKMQSLCEGGFAWLNISQWEIREFYNVYTEGTLRTATSGLQPWEQTGLKYRYLDLLKFHEACSSPSAVWRDTESKSKGKLHHIGPRSQNTTFLPQRVLCRNADSTGRRLTSDPLGPPVLYMFINWA